MMCLEVRIVVLMPIKKRNNFSYLRWVRLK